MESVVPERQAVPQSIFPRGHLQTPLVDRQARFCGTVSYCQSKLVLAAVNANAGTAVMVGSSGPASNSRTLNMEFSLSLEATTDPVNAIGESFRYRSVLKSVNVILSSMVFFFYVPATPPPTTMKSYSSSRDCLSSVLSGDFARRQGSDMAHCDLMINSMSDINTKAL